MRLARVGLMAWLVLPASAGCAAESVATTGAGTTGTSSGNLRVVARFHKFDPPSLQVPAGRPFKLDFDNQDPATVHDISIRVDDRVLFEGASVAGPAMTTYDVAALPAGTYTYVCTVHPEMVAGLEAR